MKQILLKERKKVKGGDRWTWQNRRIPGIKDPTQHLRTWKHVMWGIINQDLLVREGFLVLFYLLGGVNIFNQNRVTGQGEKLVWPSIVLTVVGWAVSERRENPSAFIQLCCVKSLEVCLGRVSLIMWSNVFSSLASTFNSCSISSFNYIVCGSIPTYGNKVYFIINSLFPWRASMI